MVAGVAVYPAGWSETAVQETCGPTADQYNIGRCHIRWAYLLAVIGCLDGIVLAALAFILATRHVRLQPDSGYPPPSLYKGEVNNAYVTDAASVSGSQVAGSPTGADHAHAPWTWTPTRTTPAAGAPSTASTRTRCTTTSCRWRY
ncbi:lipoma HMGIC fusion partner-like protein domain-containing protein [Phthorimaea operculella]|nr:lipoma HMGIC fusion partner-like protein domain-containing protein [Phthorimaea operculella]